LPARCADPAGSVLRKKLRVRHFFDVRVERCETLVAFSEEQLWSSPILNSNPAALLLSECGYIHEHAASHHRRI
jgi:hypothetical protein